MQHAVIAIIGTILVPGTSILLVPYFILRRTGASLPERIGIIEILAIAGGTVGLAFIVWVSYAFVTKGRGTPVPIDSPEEFVATGLFRRVRNPMYAGVLLTLLAEAIFFRSIWLLVYAAALWVILHIFLVVFEEPQLERRFGESYRAYRVGVPRWVPRK